MISAFLFSTFLALVGGQLSLYGNWTPTVIRYCDTIQSTDTANYPTAGGVTCGYSSYNAMNAYYPLSITSDISIGLINVGWITTEALKSQAGFWSTCKSYMTRIFDGYYTTPSTACGLFVNPPTGMPSCNDTVGNLLYRSGSGYCMKEKVCGAKMTIDFLAGPDNSSLVYSWLPVNTAALVTAGYTKVGVCYGYTKLANTAKDATNLEAGDSFY